MGLLKSRGCFATCQRTIFATQSFVPWLSLMLHVWNSNRKTPTWYHKFKANVGKYSIHGAYGFWWSWVFSGECSSEGWFLFPFVLFFVRVCVGGTGGRRVFLMDFFECFGIWYTTHNVGMDTTRFTVDTSYSHQAFSISAIVLRW